MGYLVFICLLALQFHWTLPCTYRVCYYLNWAKYRLGPSSFMPENILPHMCTHVMYAYAILKDNMVVPSEGDDLDDEWKTGMYTRVQGLRRRDPDLKVLLTVGGYFFAGKEFSTMAANETSRRIFIDDVIAYLRENEFDGLDLAWEFPTINGGVPQDRESFTTLLQEISHAFRDDAMRTNMPRLLLTAVLAPGKKIIDDAYDVNTIHTYLDFATIKAFNYHGGFDSYADHSSPLFSTTGAKDDTLTVNFTVNYYLQLGFPKEKLVLGLALYGRNSWMVNGIGMDDALNNPIDGEGPMGRYTGTRGFFAYFEYCKEIRHNMIGRRGGNPFALFGQPPKQYFLAYEDRFSLEDKLRLVRDKELLGIMFWSLDYDDFKGGFCNEGKYPLTFAAVRMCNDPDKKPIIKEDKPLHMAEAADFVVDIPSLVEEKPERKNYTVIECEEDELREYPNDCTKYVVCTDGFPFVQHCPFEMVFNKAEQVCVLSKEKC